MCSPPLIWLGGKVEAVAAPILTSSDFAGQPLYTSEVVVRRGSTFQSLDDLKGSTWAINEPSSWSGYWVTLQRVRSWSFFGNVVAAGFHQRALRMVAAGAVDGAAIDCHVLAVELHSHPELAEEIRVVETLGPAPSQPVVVRSGLPSGVKAKVTEQLLELRGATLREFFVERFVPAPDYSSIAAVVGSKPSTPAL